MGRIPPICILMVLFFCGTSSLPAALKQMLEFEEKMNKPYNMSDKLFDTGEFKGTKKYEGLKEFKTSPINDSQPVYPMPAANKSFDRSVKMPGGGGQVFTGKSYLSTDKAFPTGPAAGFSGDYQTKTSGEFTTALAPGYDKAYAGGDRRYEGPELRRRTVEIDIINQTLRNKESLKGGVLSMEEVKEILNKRE